MYERLIENYRVKREINNLFNDLIKLNAHNIALFRNAYYDLKFRIEFINFVVFHEFQIKQLRKTLNAILNKIMGAEFEQEISESLLKERFKRSL